MKSAARALGRRVLRRPRIVYRASRPRQAVALTFDDGPSPWTPQVARALEEHGCHGTFFLLGCALEQRAEIVTELAEAGHELGNHLWTHSDPERQTRSELRDELDRTAAAIGRLAGTRPVLVRPPYCGAPSKVARAAGGSSAELVVLRSVDPADWSTDSPDEIVERVLDAVQPGDIICLHDGIAPGNRGTETRAATAAAVGRLVPELIERGLPPVTVSELLA